VLSRNKGSLQGLGPRTDQNSRIFGFEVSKMEQSQLSKIEELLASLNSLVMSLSKRIETIEQSISPLKSPSIFSASSILKSESGHEESSSIKNFETRESAASEKSSEQSVDHSHVSSVYFDEADELIEQWHPVELQLHHVSQGDYRIHQVSHVQHDFHDYESETNSYSEFENFQQQYADEHPSQQELLNLWEQFNSHRSHDSEENSSQPDQLYESESYSSTDENKFLDHDNYLSSDENESLDPGGYQSLFSDASQESSDW
jgi:hypothetical protein